MTMKPLNPKDFSSEIPLLQTSWSSNSLNTLMTCPRKYMYEKILGWRSKRSSVHLEFGGHYADCIEKYHLFLCEGMEHEQALCATIRHAMGLGTRDDNGEFTPWDNEDGNKNRFTLIRALVWYFDKFQDDPAKTVMLADGTPAVELEFRFGTGAEAPDGTEYTFYGYLDRLVEFGGDIYVADNKTSKSTMSDYFFAQFNPNTQMSMYTAAGKICFKSVTKGVIIDAVQLAVGFARFARHVTHRTESQLGEWMRDALQWIKMAETFAKTETYPMNTNSCDKYGGCPFRHVCSASPEVREMYLRNDFEQKVYIPRKSRDAV